MLQLRGTAGPWGTGDVTDFSRDQMQEQNGGTGGSGVLGQAPNPAATLRPG